MSRGQLRIYLGAAPGVGKTYTMLSEGQRRHRRGTDVVIGLLETHGRQLTADMAQGLEMVPRRAMTYRGARFTEMDLDAVLARHPQVALVDELAHTNVPGCRNAKRWQDVGELLDAGIDVISTLNIQHLESLNDVVAQITGTLQRETLPDEVARQAGQIELVDMTAEALRRRMVHGNIYPPDRVEAALTHYFRPGNLTALRELALLWLANRMDEGLQRYRAEHGIAAPWATRERILVGVAGVPGEDAVIRRAARIAAGTPGSELLALHVAAGDTAIGGSQGLLDAHRDLAVSLGASYRQVAGDDVARAMIEFAQVENVTQMVIGASRHGRLHALLAGEDTGSRVTRRSGAIDVHQVPRETGRRATLPYLARSLARARPHGARYLAIVLTAAIAAVLAVAAYLMPWPGSLARVLSVLAVALVLLAAVAASLLAERAGNQAAHAARASAEGTLLARLANSLLRGHGDPPALLEEIRQLFGLTAVSLLESEPHAGPRWYVRASAGDRAPESPDADLVLPLTDTLTLAGRGRQLRPDEQRVLATCAGRLVAALQARPDGPGDEERAAGQRARSAMLAATGRDARDQIAVADRALASLASPGAAQTPAERAALIRSARRAVRRLGRLVTDLRDLSRLHAGVLDTYLRPVDLDDVLATSLEELGPGVHHIDVRIADDVPDVIADADLLSKVLTSLVADALHRSPAGRPPVVSAAARGAQVEIRVTDHGPAVPPGRGSDSLAVRLALDVTEATSGTLRCGQAPGGGRTVIITLPTPARQPAVPAARAGG